MGLVKDTRAGTFFLKDYGQSDPFDEVIGSDLCCVCISAWQKDRPDARLLDLGMEAGLGTEDQKEVCSSPSLTIGELWQARNKQKLPAAATAAAAAQCQTRLQFQTSSESASSSEGTDAEAGRADADKDQTVQVVGKDC